jgi:gluconolactonase
MLRLASFSLLLLLSCQQHKPTTGSIERIDTAINSIISKNATVEVIAQGFEWAEGPLWFEKEKMLLFSDVPKNIVYKWTNEKGKEIYLTPSGYTGASVRSGEMGSNGLARNNNGQLVLCQHGNRQVAFMNAPVEQPAPTFTAVADHYNSKKFNSPNDLVYDTKGNLYFTDPPYGLEHNMDDSSKELPFQGVYRVDTSGNISLLTDSITRPNGIALTPDETQLIVANSDSLKAKWYIYDLKADGSLSNGRIFFDATEALKKEAGNPDGLKIDKAGNIFASGPGGIWIFNKDGKVLGKIKYPLKVSNCAFSADEKTLFITADDHLLRVKMRD